MEQMKQLILTLSLSPLPDASLSLLQSHYVFTAADQILTFNVGYRKCDIHVNLCFTTEREYCHVTICITLNV